MNTNYFNTGKLFLHGECVDIEKLVWNEHPTFKGVFLKHLIKGESTDNRLSCHIVKINPGCEIGLHNHVGKDELHEILDGHGHCMIEEMNILYKKGVVGLIEADKNHSVKAEKEGLLLLAKFFPALL